MEADTSDKKYKFAIKQLLSPKFNSTILNTQKSKYIKILDRIQNFKFNPTLLQIIDIFKQVFIAEAIMTYANGEGWDYVQKLS